MSDSEAVRVRRLQANATLTCKHEGDRGALQRTPEDRAQMGSSQSPARCPNQQTVHPV